MDYDAFGGDSGPPPDLSECGICGRRFNANALVRHTPICEKSAQKKRKVFDASKQRAEGTELAQFKKSGAASGRFKGGAPAASQPRQPQPSPKKSNWRDQHKDFINTIRAARGVSAAIADGRPLPPPPPPSINPDYIQCPHCQRRFNETAAERHINFCKEQHERLGKNLPDATKKARQNARLQYKAPKLKKAEATSPGYGTAPGGFGSSGYSSGGYSSGGQSQGNTRNMGRTGSGSTRTQPKSAGTRGTNASGARGMTNGQSSRGMGNDYSDGRALRTGRTAESYSEARQLSANQRSHMPHNKSPSKPSNQYESSSYSSDDSRYGDYNSSPGSSSPYGNNMSVSGVGSKGRATSGTARFCHECGTKYPVAQAKFCCECGIKRMTMG